MRYVTWVDLTTGLGNWNVPESKSEKTKNFSVYFHFLPTAIKGRIYLRLHSSQIGFLSG